MSLSVLKRFSWLLQSEQRMADIVIIGGGLTGASIAFDAASRGLNTLLVDMQDFGAGSSSRSTHLIVDSLHSTRGKSQKWLREMSREQRLLARRAPYLFREVPVLAPIREDQTKLNGLKLNIRLSEWIAGIRYRERLESLNRDAALEAEPLLSPQHLNGAGIYTQYQTDETRLTLELLKSAVQHGAYAVNYAKVERFSYEDQRISGVVIRDLLGDRSFRVRARCIINATGPRLKRTMNMDRKESDMAYQYRKHDHIIVSRNRLPVKQAVYDRTPDNRAVITLSRGNLTYIATSCKHNKSERLHPYMTVAERDELLHAANTLFPTVGLVPEDVLAGWSSIQLVTAKSQNAGQELLQGTMIHRSSSGLLSASSSRLISSRKHAAAIVDIAASIVQSKLGLKYPACQTDTLQLCGALTVPYQEESNEQLDQLQSQGYSRDRLEAWTARYGVQSKRLMERLVSIPWKDSTPTIPNSIDAMLMSELHYSVYEEMAATPADFLLRRMNLIPERRELAEELVDDITQVMAAWLNWSTPRQIEMAESARVAIQRACTFTDTEHSYIRY